MKTVGNGNFTVRDNKSTEILLEHM
jgi:hypothetical protein